MTALSLRLAATHARILDAALAEFAAHGLAADRHPVEEARGGIANVGHADHIRIRRPLFGAHSTHAPAKPCATPGQIGNGFVTHRKKARHISF